MYTRWMRPDGVEVELGFGGVELERAALVPRLEQRAIDVHERQQLVGERRRGPRSASGRFSNSAANAWS